MTTERGKRRTKAQWQELLEQYKESGLSGVAFCRENGIGQKAFYRAKTKYGVRREQSPFVKCLPPSSLKPGVSGIQIELSQGRIHLPSGMPAQWVADLLKALSR